MRAATIAFTAALLALAPPARAANVPPLFVDEPVLTGLTEPAAIAFLPGGRMLLAEQAGRVWSVTNGVKSATPMWSRTSEVLNEGDRGLLGIAVDPNYAVNHYVYLLYEVDPDSNGVDGPEGTPAFGRLTRYQVGFADSNVFDPASRTVLMGVSWRQGPVTTTNSHAIGCLRFGRDGSLLVSIGDGGHYEYMDAGGHDPAAFGAGPNLTDPYQDIGAFRAQSLSSLNGKLLRIDPATGRGYPSNPYWDGDPNSVRSRVWAYGLRNAFRFCVRPGTGAADPAAGDPGSVYIGDVGWNAWEEIDVARPGGRNFGWPCDEGQGAQPAYRAANPAHGGCGSIGGTDDPTTPSAPLVWWEHNNPALGTPPGFTGSAAIGGQFYTGTSWPAAYRGAYLFADFVGGWIRAATVDGADHLVDIADFATGVDGPVDFAVDPVTGDLVYVALGSSQVRRIRFTGVAANAPPLAVATAAPTSGTAPLAVAFTSAGTFDPEGDPVTLQWQFGDGPSSVAPNPSHTYLAPGTYHAVLSADDGVGGVGRDTAWVIVTGPVSFPTTPVVDAFDRADAALDAPWSDQPAGLAVVGGALESSGEYCAVRWDGATYGPNQEASILIVTPDAAATELDLVLKAQGPLATAAQLELWYSAPTASVYVLTYAPEQGWVTRGTVANVTYAAGERFGARALADGTVQVYRDATLLGTVSVAGWPYAAAGGAIGLSFTGASTGRWDDFRGGNADLGVSASPVVTLLAPDGGESWVGGSEHAISWTASDDAGVTAIDVYYRDTAIAPWTPLSIGQPNNGGYLWSVHNTPTTAAHVKVVAHDAAGQTGADSSAGAFTIVRTPGGRVATTLRDFFLPGTQPLAVHAKGGTFQSSAECLTCHGNYAPGVEPGKNWKGSMMAQAARDPLFHACLAIAEQDAPSSGDLCIRCHSPLGWLSGKSQPTSGAKLDALGRDGVSCDFCHRMVDPVYSPGQSPAEDQAVLGGMLPAHVPTTRQSGQYVVDPQPRRRGPFGDALAPHATLQSAFHTQSEMCATCHDVSNPAFHHVSGAKYVAGALDAAADSLGATAVMPLERTYSEWKYSAYPAGVYQPEFAGNAAGGIVSSCQSCHMRDVTGAGCSYGTPPVRSDLPLHDMMGANTWAGGAIATLHPGETDTSAITAGANRARSMLQLAANVDVNLQTAGDSARAVVVVTNRTGHKLPTGYPEGRRMWLQLVARNAAGDIVYQSGAYDAATGVLATDAQARVYEAKLGLSPAFAASLGLPAGPSFHFALNDTLYQDNRIPPAGFTNAAYATIGATPVDPLGPSPRYLDGQNWDVATYALPPGTQSVTATLWYQTASKEYIDFLAAENTTNSAGTTLATVWAATGRSAPVTMARDSADFATLAVGTPATPRVLELRALANPFTTSLPLLLALPSAASVRLEVLDVTGRVVRRMPAARLEAGDHRLTWDARADDGHRVNPGAYWAVVHVDRRRLVKHVVALR